MKCYNCDTRVHCLEVRERDSGGSRRRYECKACGLRFTTLETLAEILGHGGDRRSTRFEQQREVAIAAANKGETK
jgi:transcriptional regulator NrdR family protein